MLSQNPSQWLARVLFRWFEGQGVCPIEKSLAYSSVAVNSSISEKWPGSTLFFQDISTAVCDYDVTLAVRTDLKEIPLGIANKGSPPEVQASIRAPFMAYSVNGGDVDSVSNGMTFLYRPPRFLLLLPLPTLLY